MIVDHPKSALPTPSQTVGPFFSFGLDWLTTANLVDPGAPEAVAVTGRVLDGAGTAVPDAVVEIWQADHRGHFPPESEPGWHGFGRVLTGPEGIYRFVTTKPGAVAGPGGAEQAPHVDVSIFARGLLQRLVTRIYFPDEADANERDPLLAALDQHQRRTLIAKPQGGGLSFDIHLQGDDETLFLAW